METVRKIQNSKLKTQNRKKSAFSITRCFVTLLFLSCSLSLFSQANYTTMQEAFAKSQEYEGRGNFADAIASLKTIYQEDS